MHGAIQIITMKAAVLAGMLLVGATAQGAERVKGRGVTSLANPQVKYRAAEKGYVTLRRGGVTAVIVDNRAVDDDVLAGHRAGYSGVALLKHEKQDRNFFVPAYAGLNFEHIHDGTTRDRDVLFEPRRAPMELRVIDAHTAELYQAPTPTWGLESCTRYHLLADGTIEMTFECVPRKDTFRHGYIGLFWASYIHQPERLEIHFRGRTKAGEVGWVRGVTPTHGVEATHLSMDDDRTFRHDADFPLTLVYNRSKHRYAEPWYYGVSGKMALVQMFRRSDGVRLTQSPSGGGRGNPAWDFQCFIDGYEVDAMYRLVMRAGVVEYGSPEQVRKFAAEHLKALEKSAE